MKFPSIQYLVMQAGASFTRFYLPLLFSIVGAIALVLQMDDHSSFLSRSFFTCILGLPFSLGNVLFSERSGNQAMKWLMPVFAIIFTCLYGYWLAPDFYVTNYRSTIIFFVLAVVMHLWVAIAPYIQNKEKTGFWGFNETLYSRMVLAMLFSVALYAGLALAILACNLLLKFRVDDEIYYKLGIMIFGVFNTWFFLAGVPADYTGLNTEKVFPKSLKIFTQYILMPIVTLYMIILYAYGLKIIGNYSLPRGWVSILILWYSVLGILAILLVSPLRDHEEMAWVRLFSKFFFIASLPLIVLLYAAILARVSQYGITELRYYLMLMGAWLGFMSVYFIVSPLKNIKIVPVSLGIIGIMSLIGPWSAFAVSDRSQLHRLEKILIKYKAWNPGQKVTESTINMEYRDENEVSDLISYFVKRNNIMAMQEVFAMDLRKLEIENNRNSHSDVRNEYYYGGTSVEQQLMAVLIPSKFHPQPANQKQPGNQLQPSQPVRNYPDLRFISNIYRGFSVAGYSKVCKYTLANYFQKQYIYPSPNDSLEVKIIAKDSLSFMEISRAGKFIESIDFNPMINLLRQKEVKYGEFYYNKLPINELTIDNKVGPLKLRILISNITIKDQRSKDNYPIRALDTWILIK